MLPELGLPVMLIEFSPLITCHRMKSFLLVTSELAQLAESIPSACFPSRQPVGSHVGKPALIAVEACVM